MSDILLYFLSDDKPNNTVYLNFVYIIYLVFFGLVYSSGIYLYSIFVLSGFWFFTSLSFFLRLKNEELFGKITKSNFKTENNSKILLCAYFKSAILIPVSFFIILVFLFASEVGTTLESGLQNLSTVFSNQYSPSNIEIIIISLLGLITIIFPYFFSKWIYYSYFNGKQKEEQINEIKIRNSTLYILLITIFSFIVSFVINTLYIDSRLKPSDFIGLEMILNNAIFFLIGQLIILSVFLFFLIISLSKIKNYTIN